VCCITWVRQPLRAQYGKLSQVRFLNMSAPSDRPLSTGAVVTLVPTLDAGAAWPRFLQAYAQQQPAAGPLVVLDSESSDGTDRLALSAGHRVARIPRADFSHGGTRQWGIDHFAADAAFVVFLTQDAVLAQPDALARLLSAFADPQVAAVYGRQLPHPGADPLSAHARLFNYPAVSRTVTLADRAALGLRTCFLSNAFAAYRLSALRQVGGFARDLILAEDMHLAARLLLAGHAVRYQADACVHHSHAYSFAQEFRRYFDTGVFHAQQGELLASFGSAGREGLQFLRSEVAHLLRTAPWRLPEAALRTALKALGYRAGRHHQELPARLRQACSMHKGYWA
jgi:rhamnosyltransferase